jgi:hypothetical protein
VKYKRSDATSHLFLCALSSLGLSSQVSIKRFFISKIKIKSLIKYTRSSGRVKGLEKMLLEGEMSTVHVSLRSPLAAYIADLYLFL